MSHTAARIALITGAGGQLGLELLAAAPAGWITVGCSSAQLDVTSPRSVADAMARTRPALVINAAAYTAVDAAEQNQGLAEAVNARGAAHLAEGARRMGARLIQISTDFVFDGCQAHPYRPEDPPNPLGVYGLTKLGGESEVARLSGGEALILRTAWLYAGAGRNFALTILRLLRERDSLGVVSDQVGTPTWTRSLAGAIWSAADRPEVRGVHHWTDAGVASWYDFAVAIQEEALAIRLLDRGVPIRPLKTEDYPTAARRPSYSVLDATATAAILGLERRHWRVNLREMLRGLARV